MNKQAIFKIMIGIAVVIIGYSCYMLYDFVNEYKSYEHATGVIKDIKISGFTDNPDFSPIISFAYQGDSITFNSSTYDSSMEIGGTVDVMFPPGKPDYAITTAGGWQTPLVFIGFALMFLVMPVVFSNYIDRSRERAKEESLVRKAQGIDDSKQSKLIIPGAPTTKDWAQGFFVCTIFGGLCVWLSYYMLQKQLSGAEDDYWVLIVIIGLFGVIFILIGFSNVVAVFIDKSSSTIEATFSKVISVGMDSGLPSWKLECTWTNPANGKLITFTSEKFSGRKLIYEGRSIKVNVYPRKPETFNLVDLSPLSDHAFHGISIVDENTPGNAPEPLVQPPDPPTQNQSASTSVSLEKEEIAAPVYKRHHVDSRFVPEGSEADQPKVPVPVAARLIKWLPVFIMVGLFAAIVFGIRFIYSNPSLDRFNDSMESQMSPGWKYHFQTDQPAPMGYSGNFPIGSYEIEYDSLSIQWYIDGIILKGNYDGSDLSKYNSESTSSVLTFAQRWHSNEGYFDDQDDYLMIADVPADFPASVRSTLSKPFASESGMCLLDLPEGDERQIPLNYLGLLFDNDARSVFRAQRTVRESYKDEKGSVIIASSDRKLMASVLQPEFWKEFRSLKSTQGIHMGILITSDGIIMTGLDYVMEPGQIKAMVEFGLKLWQRETKSDMKK